MEKIEKAYSVNLDTGEANEIIIHKEVDSQNFVKVFMADFLVALGILNSNCRGKWNISAHGLQCSFSVAKGWIHEEKGTGSLYHQSEICYQGQRK